MINKTRLELTSDLYVSFVSDLPRSESSCGSPFMASPSPNPLQRYLRVDRAAERSIFVMLRDAPRDLERPISIIAGLDKPSVSQRVRLLQLRQADRAIKKRLAAYVGQG